MKAQPVAVPRELTIGGFALLIAGGIGMVAVDSAIAAIAVPFALAGGLLLLMRPVLGLMLMVAIIPLERALLVEGRSLVLLVGMAVFATWAAQKLVRRESLIPLFTGALVPTSLLLLAFASLSWLWAEYPDRMMLQLVRLFQLILLSILVLDVANSWKRLDWVAKVLVLAGAIAVALTIAQYLTGARRAGGGVVGGINKTAVTLVTILPFAFYLFRSREALPWRLLGLGYIGSCAIAIAASLSRMNFLMFPVVVAANALLMARSRRDRRPLLLLAGAAVVAVALIPGDVVRQRAETILPYLSQSVGSPGEVEQYSARGYKMRVGLEIFSDHPVLGVGWDNYRRQYLNYQWVVPGYIAPNSTGIQFAPPSPHGSHIGFLANLGSIGGALWFSLFVIALVCLFRAWRAADTRALHKPLVEAVTIAVALQVVYGFYDDINEDKLFWVIMGLAMAAYRLSRKKDQPNDAPTLSDSRYRLPFGPGSRAPAEVHGLRPTSPT